MAKILRIPGPENAPSPVNMGASGPLAIEDNSGLAEGARGLARGVSNLAGSLRNVEAEDRRKRNASHISQAEAFYTKSLLDLGNQFDQRTDYDRFAEDGDAESQRVLTEAANFIHDPEMRQRWIEQTELRRLPFADSIGDQGRLKLQERDRAGLVDSLETYKDILGNPQTSAPLRDAMRRQAESAIGVAEAEGVIGPSEASKLRDAYLRGSDEALAENQAILDIATGNARRVYDGMGITGTALGGSNVLNGALSAAGGAVTLPPEVVGLTAAALGDKSLPSDPALAAAYLKDPEMNARYVTAAVDTLTQRFNGDITAAVIAIAPGGGLAAAERWVKSGHDEGVLPKPVLDFYRKTMEGMEVTRNADPLPIIASDDVDLARVDPNVLARWEQVQGAFGAQFPIISGFRDPAHNHAVGGASGSQHIEGRAVDVDVRKLSIPDRLRLIAVASAAGFTGIGVYENTLHFDARDQRASWGGDYHRESVPAWAEDTIKAHLSGKITDAPIAPAVGDPIYNKLPFDKKLRLWANAKQAMDQEALDKRAGIEIAMANAPAAITSTGEYTGYEPTVDEFVEAYGAVDGIAKFKEHDLNVEVAQTAYGMRTMSAEEIADLVEQNIPKSTGDMAAIETKKFTALTAAWDSIKKQREDDPAGYVMSAFPNVAAAWDNAETPEQVEAALTATAEAQTKLGMDLELLPKELAGNAAAIFNDPERSQEERIGAVAALAMASAKDEHQAAIMSQLVKAGVPPHAQGAMAALERGDSGAASYLFRAAMVDPTKLKINTEDSVTAINKEIWDTLFDEGSIGDIMYGVTDATPENLDRVIADRTLITNAVLLRLADGSAANTQEAIALTAKDMWGDVRPVTGKAWGGRANLRIVLPAGEDDRPMRAGFDALIPSVAQAASASITSVLAGAPTDDSSAAIGAMGRDQRVTKIIEEGYFAASGDGFVFVDPDFGQPVPDPVTGEPLIFTRDQVLEAGATADAARIDLPQGSYTPP